MAELSIDPDYLRHLVVKVRSFMAKEETDIPDDGSNPIDDEVPLGALQDEDDDLSREEWWRRSRECLPASRPSS